MRTIDADALYRTMIWEFHLDSTAITAIGSGILEKVYKKIMDAPTIELEQRWIPVEERLPEAGSWAIWCSNKGIIQVARWKMDAIDHFFPDQGFFQLDDAVAWMPLPKPYREKNCQQEGMTFKLNHPLTEEQWDAITDVDMEHTPMIEFHTKNGKIGKYRKVEEE